MTKLELRRKRTLDKMSHKLIQEVPQPVGFLVLGKDCMYKNAKLEELLGGSSFGGCVTVECADFEEDLDAITRSFLGIDGKLMFIFNTKQSSQPQLHKRCIESMRRAGAKTVAAICISEHGDNIADSSEFDYVLAISEES